MTKTNQNILTGQPDRRGFFVGEIVKLQTLGSGNFLNPNGTYSYYTWNGKSWDWTSGADSDIADKYNAQQSKDTENAKLTINLGSRNVSSSDALRYPSAGSEALNETSDYVNFTFYNYKPPLEGTADAADNDSFDTAGAGFQLAQAYKNYNASVVEIEPSDLPPILLYMPQDIQSEYGQDWENLNIGFAAAASARALTGNADLSTIAGNLKEGFKKVQFSAISKLTNTFAGSDLTRDQALGLTTDTIANPNTEVLFKGSNLRRFTLNFKMVADDENESKEILKICNTFKKASMPSFGGDAIELDGGAGQFLTIPNVVNVSFMSGNSLNKFLPQYKTCAITNVNINFTADGTYAAYADGAPVSIELSVSFNELKPIFANEIDITGESASF